MIKRWSENRTSNDGEEDRLIRSIMKRDVEMPAEVIEKKEDVYRKIRTSKRRGRKNAR